MAARADLLEYLAGKRLNGNWTPNPIPGRLDFFTRYRELALNIVYNFKLSESSGGPKTQTAIFSVPPIPGLPLRTIRHNFRKDVALVFEGAAHAHKRLLDARILPRSASMEVLDSGKLMIRMRTAKIVPAGELFDEQRTAIEESITLVRDLYSWAFHYSDKLVKLLR